MAMNSEIEMDLLRRAAHAYHTARGGSDIRVVTPVTLGEETMLLVRLTNASGHMFSTLDSFRMQHGEVCDYIEKSRTPTYDEDNMLAWLIASHHTHLKEEKANGTQGFD